MSCTLSCSRVHSRFPNPQLSLLQEPFHAQLLPVQAGTAAVPPGVLLQLRLQSSRDPGCGSGAQDRPLPALAPGSSSSTEEEPQFRGFSTKEQLHCKVSSGLLWTQPRARALPSQALGEGGLGCRSPGEPPKGKLQPLTSFSPYSQGIKKWVSSFTTVEICAFLAKWPVLPEGF